MEGNWEFLRVGVGVGGDGFFLFNCSCVCVCVFGLVVFVIWVGGVIVFRI